MVVVPPRDRPVGTCSWIVALGVPIAEPCTQSLNIVGLEYAPTADALSWFGRTHA
jgi:hypothetical protein